MCKAHKSRLCSATRSPDVQSVQRPFPPPVAAAAGSGWYGFHVHCSDSRTSVSLSTCACLSVCSGLLSWPAYVCMNHSTHKLFCWSTRSSVVVCKLQHTPHLPTQPTRACVVCSPLVHTPQPRRDMLDSHHSRVWLPHSSTGACPACCGPPTKNALGRHGAESSANSTVHALLASDTADKPYS